MHSEIDFAKIRVSSVGGNISLYIVFIFQEGQARSPCTKNMHITARGACHKHHIILKSLMPNSRTIASVNVYRIGSDIYWVTSLCYIAKSFWRVSSSQPSGWFGTTEKRSGITESNSGQAMERSNFKRHWIIPFMSNKLLRRRMAFVLHSSCKLCINWWVLVSR